MFCLDLHFLEYYVTSVNLLLYFLLFSSYFVFNKICNFNIGLFSGRWSVGCMEVTQWLGALASLEEDLGLILILHGSSELCVTPVQGIRHPFLASMGTRHPQCTDTHTGKTPMLIKVLKN